MASRNPAVKQEEGPERKTFFWVLFSFFLVGNWRIIMVSLYQKRPKLAGVVVVYLPAVDTAPAFPLFPVDTAPALPPRAVLKEWARGQDYAY